MTLLEKIIQDKDLNKITKIIKDLAPYDNYFNQNLMNKGEDNWNSDEFISYFHYFKFKLFFYFIPMLMIIGKLIIIIQL